MSKANKLGQKLWDIACKFLRGSMKAGDFQDYMLSFLFLRYISEKYEEEAKSILKASYENCEREKEILNKEDKKFHEVIERYSKLIDDRVEKDIEIYKNSLLKIDEYKDNKEKLDDALKAEKEERIQQYNELINTNFFTTLSLWYIENLDDIAVFENRIRKRIHYVIKPQFLWSNIYGLALKRHINLLKVLVRGLNYIEKVSYNIAFEKLFSDVNLNSDKLGRSYTDRNNMVCDIIVAIGKGISEFKEDENGNRKDVLGDAYEFLISKFASNSGAKAGEFYTPQEVSTILSEIVTLDSQNPAIGRKKTINRLLDFACGSGSLLINVIKTMENAGGEINQIYGQEKNITTYNLARMNMLLHGVQDTAFKIYNGDTLMNDWDIFSEIHPAKKIECDAVVANPPFSLKWRHNEKLKEDFRFTGYGMAPQAAADFAFLLHGFHFLSRENGTMAIILPHGVLFRGGEEAKIRRKLIEDKNIDTIIGLPANLFFSTGIPVCIIVLKKCRKFDNILFINANKEFAKNGSRNILKDEHIKKIVDTYKHRRKIDNYARCVNVDEIIRNDYNLNISRYVSTAVEDKIVNLEQVQNALNDIEGQITTTKAKVNSYLKELGLPELK